MASCKPIALMARSRLKQMFDKIDADPEVVEKMLDDVIHEMAKGAKDPAGVEKRVARLQDRMIAESLRKTQSVINAQKMANSFFAGKSFNANKTVASMKTLYWYMRDMIDTAITKRHFESQDLFSIFDNETIRLDTGEDMALGDILVKLDQDGEYRGLKRRDIIDAIFKVAAKDESYKELYNKPTQQIAEKMYALEKNFSDDYIQSSPLGREVDFRGFHRKVDIETLRRNKPGSSDYFDFKSVRKTLDLERTLGPKKWRKTADMDGSPNYKQMSSKMQEFAPDRREVYAEEIGDLLKAKKITDAEARNLTSELELYNKIYEANLRDNNMKTPLIPIEGREADFIEASGYKNPLNSTRFNLYKTREAAALDSLFGGHTSDDISMFFNNFVETIDSRLNHLSENKTIKETGNDLMILKKLAVDGADKMKKKVDMLTETRPTQSQSIENWSQAASRALSGVFLGKLPLRMVAESFLNFFGMARHSSGLRQLHGKLLDFAKSIDLNDPATRKALAQFPMIFELKAHGASRVNDRFESSVDLRSMGLEGSKGSQRALKGADSMAWFTNKWTGSTYLANARRLNGILEGMNILSNYLKDTKWDDLPVFFKSNAERAGIDASMWKVLQAIDTKSGKLKKTNGEFLDFLDFTDVKKIKKEKIKEVLGEVGLNEALQGMRLDTYRKRIFDSYTSLVHKIGTDGSFMASVLTRQDLFGNMARGTVPRAVLSQAFKFLGPASQQARRLAAWTLTDDGLYRNVFGTGGIFDPTSGRNPAAIMQGATAIVAAATTYWFISNLARGKVPESLPDPDQMVLELLNMGMGGAWSGIVSSIIRTGDMSRAAGNFPVTGVATSALQVGKAGIDFLKDGELSEDRKHQLLRAARLVAFPSEFWYSKAMFDYFIGQELLGLEQTNRQKKSDEKAGQRRLF